MFEDEDALPCSEGHFSEVDRDIFAGSGEGHSEVAGGIVGSFQGMHPFGILLIDQVVECGVQIFAG